MGPYFFCSTNSARSARSGREVSIPMNYLAFGGTTGSAMDYSFLYNFFHIFRQRRVKGHLFMIKGVGQRIIFGVKGTSGHAKGFHQVGGASMGYKVKKPALVAPVELITQDGVAQVQQVHPYLVQPSRLGEGPDHGKVGISLCNNKACTRLLGGMGESGPFFANHRVVIAAQGDIHGDVVPFGDATHQGGIFFEGPLHCSVKWLHVAVLTGEEYNP